MHTVTVPTQEGQFVARFSERGLAGLDFPGRNGSLLSQRSTDPAPARLAQWEKLTVAALRALLNGRRPGKLPPLDWTGATDFQRSIWKAMLGIPPGRTRTYAEVAATADKPKAARAAGAACGANPIPVLVPCHRVVAAGGRLGGFSGGLDWKRKLLAREGVVL